MPKIPGTLRRGKINPLNRRKTQRREKKAIVSGPVFYTASGPSHANKRNFTKTKKGRRKTD